MTADARLGLAWTARDEPLAARAAVGGAAGRRGRRLAELDDARRAGLTAVAGPGALVVLGESERLPWVDGVIYLGRDPAAPELLVPTALAPTVPAALLAHALR